MHVQVACVQVYYMYICERMLACICAFSRMYVCVCERMFLCECVSLGVCVHAGDGNEETVSTPAGQGIGVQG